MRTTITRCDLCGARVEGTFTEVNKPGDFGLGCNVKGFTFLVPIIKGRMIEFVPWDLCFECAKNDRVRHALRTLNQAVRE